MTAQNATLTNVNQMARQTPPKLHIYLSTSLLPVTGPDERAPLLGFEKVLASTDQAFHAPSVKVALSWKAGAAPLLPRVSTLH